MYSLIHCFALLAIISARVHSTPMVLTQTLSTFRDLFYALPVTIGTPPQSFRLILQTDTNGVLVTDQCCVQCCHAAWYRPDKSQTSSAWRGHDDCYMMIDTVGDQGRCFDFEDSLQVVANNGNLVQGWYQVGMLQNVSADAPFPRQPFDGVMGFGGITDKTLIRSAVVHGTIPSAVYTIYLKQTCVEGVAPDGGTITYGGVDTVNCDENVHYSDSDDPPMLTEISLGAITIRNDSWFAETSTIQPNIVLPNQDVLNTLLRQLDGRKEGSGYTVNCSQVSSFDNVRLTMDSVQYSITPYRYVYKSTADGKCYLRFSVQDASGIGADSFSLGLPFLYRQCEVHVLDLFHLAKDRVGWSEHKSPDVASDMCEYPTAIAEARSAPACTDPEKTVNCANENTMPASEATKGTTMPADAVTSSTSHQFSATSVSLLLATSSAVLLS